MTISACALGLRAPRLTAELRAVLREARPWGLILFREACAARAQVLALCAEAREAVGHNAVIAIDQEGGRVARMRPPEWGWRPPAAAYGALHARDPAAAAEAAALGHRLIAHDLKTLGVNLDFAPVLDLPVDGSDPIIGDRAFGHSPEVIAALAGAAMDGLHAGGVLSCVKHIPGHGRAEVDSHLKLPVVAAGLNALGQDFAPFRAHNTAPMAMTAHIVYAALDPELPATWSKPVLNFVRADIGFSGLLSSDDLDMKALDGPMRSKAERAIAAGCDIVLQCNGEPKDMAAAAEGAGALDGVPADRAARAKAIADAASTPFDPYAAEWRWRTLLAG